MIGLRTIIYLGILTTMLFMSCTPRGIHPLMYSPYLGPRMIQPVEQKVNPSKLPESPNFTHSYHNYRKSKADSKFGALVRILEFEYDIADTFFIIPRFTSGFDEGEMTGIVKILIDQYELTYEAPKIEIREYVEEVSYESPQPVQNVRPGTYPPTTSNVIVNTAGQPAVTNIPRTTAALHNTMQEKPTQVINRSQIYNTARIAIEDDDINLLLRSNTLSFVIHLRHANLDIYPTKDQIRVLKRMLQKHYRK